MSDPRNIHAHARSMMIEQIMALIGRASSDPKSYRRTLNSWETATLRRLLESIELGDVSKISPALTEALPIEQIEANPNSCGCTLPAREIISQS